MYIALHTGGPEDGHNEGDDLNDAHDDLQRARRLEDGQVLRTRGVERNQLVRLMDGIRSQASQHDRDEL